MDDDARPTTRSIPRSHRHRDDGRDRSDRLIDRSIDRPARTTRSDHDPIRTIDRSHASTHRRRSSTSSSRARFHDRREDDARLRRWVTTQVTVAASTSSSSPIGRRARVLVLLLVRVASSSSHLRESVHRRRVAISRARAKIRFDRVVEGG